MIILYDDLRCIMNNKNYNEIMEALLKLREDIDLAHRRRRDKLTIRIDKIFTLKEALSHYTKDELHKIRRTLKIKNVSQLNKREIIDVLVEQIPIHFDQFFYMTFDKPYKLLQKIYKSNGIAQRNIFHQHEVEYLRTKGFIFYGIYKNELVVAMPKELCERFRQINDNLTIKNKIRKNTEWIHLTNGLLYYYGTLSILELKKLIEKYTKESVDENELFHVIEEQNYCEDDKYVHSGRFTSVYVDEVLSIIEEHLRRKDLDYYPFTKKQILEAAKEDFVDRSTAYKHFVNLLLEFYDISKVEADEFVEMCMIALNNGSEPIEVLEMIQDQFEIPDKKVLELFLYNIVNLHNHTRLWVLKGYKPAELFEKEKQALQPIVKQNSKVVEFNKVRRNEPCPCGSGKKYKHCCGK